MAKRWLKWLGYKFDNPKPKGLHIPKGFQFFYKYGQLKKGLGD
jgi:hypothetical protein